MSRGERKAMIVPGRPGLSLSRQCRLLSISRSSFYYQPVGETAQNLALMRVIDAQFLETPWYGSRQMARHLRLVKQPQKLPEPPCRSGCIWQPSRIIRDLQSGKGVTLA